MSNSAELREKRMNIAHQMGEIVKKETMTPEDEQSFDRMEKEERELKNKIDRLEKVEALNKDIEAPKASIGRETREVSEPSKMSLTEKRESAFRSYVRKGLNGMSEDLRNYMDYQNLDTRALSGNPSNGSTGGYSVPTFWESNFVEVLKAFNGIRQAPVSTLTTDGGNIINYTTVDDTANKGELIDENTATASDQYPTFGQVAVKAYNFSSKIVLTPIQLLQDSAVDMDVLLPRQTGTRIARKQQDLFTFGTGTAQPQGIVTGASDSTISIDNDNLTDGQYMWQYFTDAMHTIDPAYRQSPSFGFMFHDDTLRVLKRLTDSQKRPLWVPDARSGEPDRICGQRYYINQSMDTTTPTDSQIASSSSSGSLYKPVLVGDFSAFLVRDVRGVQLLRLQERYAEYFQVGFLAYQRSDSRVLNSAAIKYVTLAA